jgi:peptidoglycan-N-acetylglucosamine deacetylase
MRVLPSSRRARKWTIIALVVLVVLAGGAYGLNELASARGFQFFGGLTNRVETTEKVVALTFDDGPDPAGTQPLLDTLARADVRATFYLIGRDLTAHPDLGKAIAAAGHELGNHSFSHERMVLVSTGFVASEVERTDTLIRATGYQGEITFRPPNGKKLFTLPQYLSEHNRKTITWDVEPDSTLPSGSASELVQDALAHVRPGSIILLHGMYASREQTRLAVEPLINRLREQGYRFVTVSSLLSFQGK